jgi:hypothetical protein
LEDQLFGLLIGLLASPGAPPSSGGLHLPRSVRLPGLTLSRLLNMALLSQSGQSLWRIEDPTAMAFICFQQKTNNCPFMSLSGYALNPIAFRVVLQALDSTTIALRALRLEHVCRLNLPTSSRYPFPSYVALTHRTQGYK